MTRYTIVTARIGGTPESVQQLLDGLPGDHQAEHLDGQRYSIATTRAGFLRFAITSQGYGEVLMSTDTWTCMVCLDERPDADISVHKVHATGPVQITANVRYCNDRARCHLGAPAVGLRMLGR